MSQTKEGAIKARETMIKKFGEHYYAKIGAIGGRISRKKKNDQ